MSIEASDTIRLELRRGVIILAVLAQLRQEHYGYSLCKALMEKGFYLEESTLYPLLRRLEKQGLLESQWRMDAKRKKRFYHLSTHGQQLLSELTQEWHDQVQLIGQLLKG